MLLHKCSPESHGRLIEFARLGERRMIMQQLAAMLDHDGTGGTLAYDLKAALTSDDDQHSTDWLVERIQSALLRIHRLYDMHRASRLATIDGLRFLVDGVSMDGTAEGTAEKFRSAAKAVLAKAERGDAE